MPSHTEHDQNNTHQWPPRYVSSYAGQNMACSKMADPEHHSRYPRASHDHFPARYYRYGGDLQNAEFISYHLCFMSSHTAVTLKPKEHTH